MPNWNDILNEVKACGSPHDVVRRKYLRQLYERTKRNVIVYYSGWLQHGNSLALIVNDEDKNGFMTTVNNLDRSKGLDLILHTPGGDTAATESLVHYLRAMFDNDIRAIVPQLALSAGTMIACASKEILMGKQSSLGPVDPQLGGIAAHGAIEEFQRAHAELKADASKIAVWQPIIANYRPTFIGECEKAVKWSEQLITEWLKTNMFRNDPERETKVRAIVNELTDHALTLSHARHLSFDKCRKLGIKVRPLEEDDELQDAVLSVHHACMLTLSQTGAGKLIENHDGTAFIKLVQAVIVQR